MEVRNVLDHGRVELVRVTPDPDQVVVEAARVSVSGLRAKRDDAKLIRYLIDNRHLSPLEHVQYTFRLRLPLFVKQQLDTYRTAHRNAKSARYCAVDDEPFYLPDVLHVRRQSAVNKQGSDGMFPSCVAVYMQDLMQSVCTQAVEAYRYLLQQGVARELARTVLPVAMYTEEYWTIDLRNLLHVIEERTSEHAQFEIREYGKVFAEIVKETAPLVWAAWVGEMVQERDER